MGFQASWILRSCFHGSLWFLLHLLLRLFIQSSLCNIAPSMLVDIYAAFFAFLFLIFGCSKLVHTSTFYPFFASSERFCLWNGLKKCPISSLTCNEMNFLFWVAVLSQLLSLKFSVGVKRIQLFRLLYVNCDHNFFSLAFIYLWVLLQNVTANSSKDMTLCIILASEIHGSKFPIFLFLKLRLVAIHAYLFREIG